MRTALALTLVGLGILFIFAGFSGGRVWDLLRTNIASAPSSSGTATRV